MLKAVVSLFLLLTTSNLFAAEESLDLDAVAAPKPTASTSSAPKFHLMGRVDLSLELGNTKAASDTSTNYRNFKNNHLLFFLKAKASDKVSLMGEFVGQSFVNVDYTTQLATIQFGKIIVPFGDTRRFHHFYGGVQGYGASGVMLKNIWAEPGANVVWHTGLGDIDLYVVNSNSVNASSETTDPSLQNTASSGSNTQAGGLRWSPGLGKNVNAILSIYQGDYWPGKIASLGGADLYSDYGAWNWGLFSRLRWAMGMAVAQFNDAPQSGTFQKRGDYLELATNLLPAGELRVRYGTYIDNNKVESNKDVHSLNLGYAFNVDVVRILIENQWNYEAVNEFNNDLIRIMTSVDF